MTARSTSLMRVAGVLAAFAAAPALAQTPSATDAEFVQKAIAGNTLEIEEAKLAIQRATDPKLKQFAQAMVDHHADALAKLGQAAGKPATPTLDKPRQAMLDNLKGFNGADFDKIYQADQVASHAETVALLSDYVQNGQNNDLKSWAKNALPLVKGHRATINAM